MITLVDLIQLIALFAGTLAGVAVGHDRFGVIGAIAGGIAGFFVGAYFGIWPKRWSIQQERKKYSAMTTEQLLEGLYDPKSWTPNYFLMELQSRGEDIQQHYDLVLGMMESDSSPLRRQLGYAALLSAFPGSARKLKGYNPASSAEVCKAKVAALRNEA